MLGTLLEGRYQIQGRLGAGGMAIVFLAVDRELDRKVAVKVMRPGSAGDNRLRQRFEREAAAAAKLSHPNIIEVYSFGRLDDDSLYYVMEHLDCPSISECIHEEGAFDEKEVLPIMKAIASALAHVHPRGLIHRDLKPSNVMLVERGVPKVVDFGLVHDEGRTQLTKTGEMVGTPQYCSPELIEGIGVDGRSDIYQLGAIAYELLTGKKAFDAKSLQGVLGKIIAGFKPPFDDVGIAHRWESFVYTCLEADPDDRFQTADDALAALEKIRLHDRPSRPAVLVDTSSQQALTDSSSSTAAFAAGPSHRAVLASVLLLIGACLFFVVISSRGPRTTTGPVSSSQTVPARFEKPRLLSLGQVLLRYTKSVSGPCRLSFSSGGYEERTIDLAEGTAASANLLHMTINLQPVLLEDTTMTITYGNAEKQQRYLLAATDLIDRELAIVDSLHGETFDRLRHTIGGARKKLEARAKAEPGADLLPQLRADMLTVLDTAGLDKATVTGLNEFLPQLLDGRVKPGHPIARRLLPLRQLETAGWSTFGYAMPWGSIAKMLGYAGMKATSPAPGTWVLLAEHKLGAPNSKRPWVWLTPAEIIEQERANPASAQFVYTSVLNRLINIYGPMVPGEKESSPQVPDIDSSRPFTFEVRAPARASWPPKEVYLSFVTRLFSRCFTLKLVVNGRPEITVVNAYWPVLKEEVPSAMHSMRHYLPIEPAAIAQGGNRLTVTVVASPGTTAQAAVNVRDLRVYGVFE